MQKSPVDMQSLEPIARDIGRDWGVRLKADHLTKGKTLGTWPGTLDEARRLVDVTAGRRLEDQERELLALLVERGARRAWHSRDQVARGEETHPSVRPPSRSGVMVKPGEWPDEDDGVAVR
jgi:hypothetical protein